MEPRQYTGKTGATPNEGSAGEPAQPGAVEDAAIPSPAPAPVALGRAGARPARPAPAGSAMRIVTWSAVLVALVLGLALYFRYERAVAPLFGRGR